MKGIEVGEACLTFLIFDLRLLRVFASAPLFSRRSKIRNQKCSPFAVRGTFGRDFTRRAVDVGQTSGIVARIWVSAGHRRPVLLVSNRIDWNFAHVAGAD